MQHAVSKPFLIALGLVAVATPAIAAEQVIALSPAEKEKLLDAAADRDASALGEPAVNGVDRRPHGDVGMFLGNHGARGVFGSTVVPLGEGSTLGVSVATSRFGR